MGRYEIEYYLSKASQISIAFNPEHMPFFENLLKALNLMLEEIEEIKKRGFD